MEIHAHREPPFNHPTAKIKHLLTAASRSGLLRLAFKALPILALTLLYLLGLRRTRPLDTVCLSYVSPFGSLAILKPSTFFPTYPE